MSDTIHTKKNGSKTIIGKNGIKGNLPSDKAKVAPTPGLNREALTSAASNKIDPLIPNNVKIALALRARLEVAWNAETSAGGYSAETPSTGQCAVTSMIVQDLLGGELIRVINMGISHYYNRLDNGVEIDLTRDQFSEWNPEPAVVRERSYLDSGKWTMPRYNLLCERLNLLGNPIS